MKKFFSLFFALTLLLQSIPLTIYANSSSNYNLEEKLIERVYIQKEVAIEDIKNQLIEQDR